MLDTAFALSTANEVITDLNPSPPDEVGALLPETDGEHTISPQRSPSASACEAYRQANELGFSRGRNAMADLAGLGRRV